MPETQRYDVFLSFASPDSAWVTTLEEQLRALGLNVFLDRRELNPGDNFVIGLSDGLRNSRSLAIVLSQHSVQRPWVETEWTSYMAKHGGEGTILPVLLETVEKPTILEARIPIDATHRDAAKVASEIAQAIGKPGQLTEDDSRRMYLGEHLTFVLKATQGEDEDDDGDKQAIFVTNPLGKTRRVAPPWKTDTRFTVAYLSFKKLTENSAETDQQRMELVGHATELGELLFDMLLKDDEAGLKCFQQASIPGRRPLVRILSDDDWLLSLPWELLHHDDSFLVRDGKLDLVRSTSGPVDPQQAVHEPAVPFRLVVNVSAPRGLGSPGQP